MLVGEKSTPSLQKGTKSVVTPVNPIQVACVRSDWRLSSFCGKSSDHGDEKITLCFAKKDSTVVCVWIVCVCT